jgi:nucleotide-binding universal stress UspA family protein
MFRKIMAATENPTFCDEKVRTAASLADKNNGKLFILHILESTSSMYRNFVRHFKTGEEIVSDDGYREEVRGEIEKHCGKFVKNSEILVRDGFPWEEVAKLARKRNLDLVVLGPHQHGREPFEVKRTTGKIGTTAEGVVQRAQCPVMLVNGPVSEKRLSFQNILAAVDYSESCGHALNLACRLASESRAKPHVFHMSSAVSETTGETAGFDVERQRRKLEEFCRRIKADLEAEYIVVQGDRPQLEILKYARDQDMDLILMGSHTKRKEDGNWISGGVVQGVGARSDCPVIVVTDPRALRSR